MFSGGKDSTYAVHRALEEGWDIKYLLSIKPSRTDCYLFHYATVEHTKLQAQALGIPQIYLKCDVANPIEEARIVKSVVAKNPVDAIIFGGIGLQETQIRSVKDAVADLGIRVFAAHESYDHAKLMQEMIDKGYDIRITAVASEGLDKSWLGRKLDQKTLFEIIKLSKKYGFHEGFEGGYADTFVCDGPIFKKKIELFESKPVWERTSGYLVTKAKLAEKKIAAVATT